MKSSNLRKIDFIDSKPHLELFWVDINDGFLIWDELEKVCGRKMSEKCKITHFLGKNP